MVQIHADDEIGGDACPWLAHRKKMRGQCLPERVHCFRVKHGVVGELESVDSQSATL